MTNSRATIWKPTLIAAGSFLGGLAGVWSQSLWLTPIEAQAPALRATTGPAGDPVV